MKRSRRLPDMAEGVHSHVPKVVRILHLADPKGIQNDQKYPLKLSHPRFPSRQTRCPVFSPSYHISAVSANCKSGGGQDFHQQVLHADVPDQRLRVTTHCAARVPDLQAEVLRRKTVSTAYLVFNGNIIEKTDNLYYLNNEKNANTLS